MGIATVSVCVEEGFGLEGREDTEFDVEVSYDPGFAGSFSCNAASDVDYYGQAAGWDGHIGDIVHVNCVKTESGGDRYGYKEVSRPATDEEKAAVHAWIKANHDEFEKDADEAAEKAARDAAEYAAECEAEARADAMMDRDYWD